MTERRSGTVTFLFTDIEGSTELLKKLGREQYGELLHEQQRLVREAFSAHHGEEIDTQGDSFFAAFHRASDAVAASVAIERALASHAWPDGAVVRVRIGIHTGEADAAGERYVGFSVHRAARIGAVAHGGQILLSSSARELVEDDLPPNIFLRDLGLFRLKDVDRPERISQVAAEGLQAEFPPLRGAERIKTHAPRRRTLLAAALIGVIAAAVAIPVFAISSGGSGHSVTLASPGSNAVSAIEASSDHPAGSTALDAAPKAIAFGESSAWVTMPSQNAVARIDPTTHSVQQTIGTGNGPTSVAVGGGFAWVANSLEGTLWQIDPHTNGGQVVDKIDVGNGPTGVAYGLDAVWVANSVDRTVLRIDPLTGAKGRPIPVDAGADAIAVGDGAVWVTSEAQGVLSRVDPKSGGVTPINVGNQPVAVAVGPGAVWVANSGDASVWKIDPVTNRVKATVDVGEAPSGVAVSPDGKSVWVSNELSGTLTKIDAAAGKPVDTVTVGDLPQGVAATAETAYVAVSASGGGAHRGGTLTLINPHPVSDSGLPESLDPANGHWELTTLTNDGLLGYARTGGAEGGKVVPDLAKTLPTVSDGGRTYTFQLRPGLRYSTGAPVRAEDIRRGIEHVLATLDDDYLREIVGGDRCTTKPMRCDLSQRIAIDPASNTVTFHLTAPDPDFVYKLALPAYVAIPANSPLHTHLPLPATGPYAFGHVDAKRGVVTLVRNPNFHVWSPAAQPEGSPDQIVEKWGYTGKSAVRAVEQGAADITSDGSDQTWGLALATSLRTRYSSRLYETPTLYPVGLWLNTRVAPFDDVRVRRALSYAVDRNHLIELAGGPDVARVGCQMLPPNVDGYRPYCPYTVNPNSAGTYTGPDLAKARQLVAASGTKGQNVTVWFFDVPIGRKNGAYIVSVLRSLGYKAHLGIVSSDTWRPKRQAGVGGIGATFPSPNDAFGGFTCRSPYNSARFCSRRIDAEIARAASLQVTDRAAASRLWTKIDRELTDLAPWIVIRESIAADFVSRRTHNYTGCWLSYWNSATGACLGQLWVR